MSSDWGGPRKTGNIGAMLSDIGCANVLRLLNNTLARRRVGT